MRPKVSRHLASPEISLVYTRREEQVLEIEIGILQRHFIATRSTVVSRQGRDSGAVRGDDGADRVCDLANRWQIFLQGFFLGDHCWPRAVVVSLSSFRTGKEYSVLPVKDLQQQCPAMDLTPNAVLMFLKAVCLPHHLCVATDSNVLLID